MRAKGQKGKRAKGQKGKRAKGQKPQTIIFPKEEKCKIQSKKSEIAYLAKTDNSLEAVPRPSCFHTELETLPRQRGPSPSRAQVSKFSQWPTHYFSSAHNTSNSRLVYQQYQPRTREGLPKQVQSVDNKPGTVSELLPHVASNFQLPTCSRQSVLSVSDSASQIFSPHLFIVLCRFSSVGDTHFPFVNISTTVFVNFLPGV